MNDVWQFFDFLTPRFTTVQIEVTPSQCWIVYSITYRNRKYVCIILCVWTFTQVSFHPISSLLSICSVRSLSLFYPFLLPPSKRHKWMSPMLFVSLNKEVVEELVNVDKIDWAMN